MCEKIDFVLPWLDGNDPKWREQKDEAIKAFGLNDMKGEDANDDSRFRDMGLLKYWFRSVEKFAPWVNKVFFVTCGQKPEWLNENHPKLVLVNHKDYIPSEYLPTFNSNTIELNLQRIPELSEQFVIFNDDIFLLKPIKPDFFFRKGEPVLPANLYISHFYGNNNISKVCINDFCTVNEHFNIEASIWENRRKWFNIFVLGPKLCFMNILRYMVNKTFSVGVYEHLANPHLKSTFKEVWDECPDILNNSSMSRFRSDIQVNHWLMIAWNLAKGRFYPVGEGNRGDVIHISNDTIEATLHIIKKQKMSQLCVNDSYRNSKPQLYFQEIAKAFDSILPEKSNFEKFV